MFVVEETRQLTEDSSGRDGLSVQPERHLGEDDRHDAGQIRLDHKVTNFPLQVEVGCHHNVLSCCPLTKDKEKLEHILLEAMTIKHQV